MEGILERMKSLSFKLASPSQSRAGRRRLWLREAFNDDQAQPQPDPIATLEPVFPLELEREIFEIAALSHRPCIVQLALVAHRVRLWMEPFLYSILVMAMTSLVYQYPPLDLFSNKDYGGRRQKKTNLKLERIGPYVRQMLLQGVTIHTAMDLLKACPNVHHLALWYMDENQGRSPQLVPILKYLPIRSLSLYSSKAWVPFGPDDRAFQHLTHLFIISRCAQKWADLEGLSLLPKLSHLALNHERWIPKIFEECKTLKLVVSFGFQGRFGLPFNAQHFVLSPKHWKDGSLLRWERGARSEAENDEFWAMVEELNRRRLNIT